MPDLKVAFIGAGTLANAAHYPSVASLDNVEIVGISDLDETRLNDTAGKFAVKSRYADYRKMLDELKPDAVYAIMPPQHLFDVAMDVIERGHHLFVEKPSAIALGPAVALGEAALRHNIISAVGFQRRYHPLVRACYDKVRETGDIQQVNVSFYKYLAPSDKPVYFRGNIDILRSDVIHCVDAIRFYAGLAGVEAVASEVRLLDCAEPMSWNALIYFDNDVLGVLHGNFRSGTRLLQFEFHGMGAVAFVDADGAGTVYAGGEAEPVLDTTFTRVGGDETWQNQGWLAEHRAFADAVIAGTPLHNDLADAAESTRLCDLIYQSTINEYEIKV